MMILMMMMIDIDDRNDIDDEYSDRDDCNNNQSSLQ